MSETVAVVGAGGFGREIAALLVDLPSISFAGFYDDSEPIETRLTPGQRWLGPISAVDTGHELAIGIGNIQTRRLIADKTAASGAQFSRPLVHPTAWVGPLVHLSRGVVVCANSSITTNIVIGEHVHINLNCTIGHDSIIEPFVTLSPGVHISGNVTIHEAAELGTGCVILPQITIGAEARVGAGAVVNRDVPPGATVVGIPARER